LLGKAEALIIQHIQFHFADDNDDDESFERSQSAVGGRSIQKSAET